MEISKKLLQLLGDWEGRSCVVYLDSGGEPTIGVGHLITRLERKSGKIKIGNEFVSYSKGLTDNQVDQLLKEDLQCFADVITDNVKVLLNQDQFDALVSFSFNVGESAFKCSTLLKVLNKSEFDQVPTQMRRWVYDNGRKVKGLVNRREKEIQLWLGKV